MGREWLWWAGEFGLAAVVAVVAGFVTRDVPISILYGLFVGTVFFVLREHRRVVVQHERQVYQMEDKALNLPVTLRDIKDVDPYLKQVAQSARDDALRIAKDAANGGVILNLQLHFHVWSDFIMLAKPGDKYFGTNYGIMARTPEYEMQVKRNLERVEKGVDITRIFIESNTSTPEEKKRIREEMNRQKEHIKVRFVKENHLPQEARGYNMGLIPGKYVGYSFWPKLMGTSIRQVPTELRVFTNPDELKKAQGIIDTILKLSEEYK
jgi:hypothetical protein